MKKWWKYFVLTGLILSPQIVCADIDMTTLVSDVAETASRDMGEIKKGVIDNLQKEATDLRNPDFSSIKPISLKELGQKIYKQGNEVLQVSDKIPANLVGKINGDAGNPDLQKAIKSEFTLTKRSNDDVKKNQLLHEKENELMIENVSVLYARGLVQRYILDQEQDEEVEDFNNINEVQAVLTNTLHRANNRWISILLTESSTTAQTAMKQLTAIRTDEAEGEKKEQ